jgi:Asp-tRNA(Asn)/Glu-tRNA(Gln) amidotransferase A subunit family amidase
VAKRWYNFFVVSEQAHDAQPGAEALSRVAAGQTPKRAADLAPGSEQETAFSGPVADPVALGEIYAAARIATPAHGYSILKIAEMLESEHIRDLPAEVKRKSILVALDAAGVKLEEIVEDAVQRDRALDAYERILEKELEELRRAKQTENQRLEQEIEQRLRELRGRIEENSKEVYREQEALSAWRAAKRAEEDRIARAVGYFVTENPVTAHPDNSGGGGHVP